MLFQALPWLYVALLLAAAAQDVASLRISNLFSLAIVATCLLAFADGVPASWWHYPLSFSIVLALGMPLFALRWMGGGDVKLFAAAALAFDLQGLIRLVSSVLIIGGLLALFFLLLRLFVRSTVPLADRRSIPYGVAIAAGAIASAFLFPAQTVFG